MQWCSKGGDGGGPPRAALLGGGGKIEVIPKNKNREDLKKVVKNMGGGAKNNLGGEKIFLGV